MAIIIEGVIEEETLKKLENGAVKNYEVTATSCFIKTPSGYLSIGELLLLIYNNRKDKPFRITLEPIEGEIKVEPHRSEFMISGIYKDGR